MANIEVRHLDCSNSGSYATTETMIKFFTGEKVIKINIYDRSTSTITSITLDKSTAIKFAKTLRTEINKIT